MMIAGIILGSIVLAFALAAWDIWIHAKHGCALFPENQEAYDRCWKGKEPKG